MPGHLLQNPPGSVARFDAWRWQDNQIDLAPLVKAHAKHLLAGQPGGVLNLSVNKRVAAPFQTSGRAPGRPRRSIFPSAPAKRRALPPCWQIRRSRRPRRSCRPRWPHRTRTQTGPELCDRIAASSAAAAARAGFVIRADPADRSSDGGPHPGQQLLRVGRFQRRLVLRRHGAGFELGDCPPPESALASRGAIVGERGEIDAGRGLVAAVTIAAVGLDERPNRGRKRRRVRRRGAPTRGRKLPVLAPQLGRSAGDEAQCTANVQTFRQAGAVVAGNSRRDRIVAAAGGFARHARTTILGLIIANLHQHQPAN